MAFTKPQELPTGATVTTYRVGFYRVDYSTREASAHFTASITPESPRPLVPLFAKLRLTGEAFDRYLSKATLAQPGGADIVGRLYEAAKVEPAVCDFGADFFHDAVNS